MRRLGDLFHFKNGRGFKKEEWGTSGLPIIRIQNLNNENAPFNYFSGEYSADILVEPDDLLFSWSGTVGSSFGSHLWRGEVGLLNQHIFKIGLRDDISKRYAFYGLRFITEEIEKSVSGAVGLVHITKEKLNDFILPIPPISEQNRIVLALDEAFDGIATAKANAKKNLQNARALFESYLDFVFTKSKWAKLTLGDVCKFVGGSQPPKSVFEKAPSPDNVRLIQIRDYKGDKNIVFIPRSLARRYCNKDDVMIGRYGPPIFQILRGLDGAYNVALMKAEPDEKLITKDFLFYFLRHSAILDYVIFHAERAAGQIGLNKETLEPYPIAMPPLAEQRETVKKINAIEVETRRLESIYQRKLAALDELKQSLLHQAFNGTL